MTPSDIEALFTDRAGTYRFARWTRPIVPVVFGTDDVTLGVLKGAIEAVVATAGHRMAETDPEQGANLFVFFLRDWDEIAAVPDLEGLVPGIGDQVAYLAASGADQYRQVRFEADGAIRAMFVFLRLGGPMGRIPAGELALALAVRAMLLWGERAFTLAPPLVAGPVGAVLRPEIASVLRVAYDPVLPAASTDPSHALRLMARVAQAGP